MQKPILRDGVHRILTVCQILHCRQQTSGTTFHLTISYESHGFECSYEGTLRLRGYRVSEVVEFRYNGQVMPAANTCRWDGDDLLIELGAISREGLDVEITLAEIAYQQRDNVAELAHLLAHFRMSCHACRPILTSAEAIVADPQRLAPYLLEFTEAQLRALVEIFADAGYQQARLPDGRDLLYWWNPHSDADFTVRVSRREEYSYHALTSQEQRHGWLTFSRQSAFPTWQARVNHLGLYESVAEPSKEGHGGK